MNSDINDDIVTRLRGKTPVQTRPCIRGGCCEICESILDSAHEAADEIERLREQVNTIANAQDGWGRVPRLEAEIEGLAYAGDDRIVHDTVGPVPSGRSIRL